MICALVTVGVTIWITLLALIAHGPMPFITVPFFLACSAVAGGGLIALIVTLEPDGKPRV